MHLVIAHYNEGLSWLDSLSNPYTIYCKGEPSERPHIRLENKGRESDTFLRYIIEYYNNLPDLIGFLQGNPLIHDSMLIWKVSNHYNEDIKFLGGAARTISLNRVDWPPELPLKEIADKLFYNQIDPDFYFTFAYGAQYAVTKEIILRKSYDWWQHALSVHEQYINYSGRNCAAPWLFERLWPLIWNFKT
jgi:hypothetical protein